MREEGEQPGLRGQLWRNLIEVRGPGIGILKNDPISLVLGLNRSLNSGNKAPTVPHPAHLTGDSQEAEMFCCCIPTFAGSGLKKAQK